ncbi:MAG: hypothetical protein HGA45_07440, partial [Chloroflexales bacterium]|nr:hypothetical protein [Chloroflexales bacterium]
TALAGDFRPQLARSAAWLKARPTAVPSLDLVLRALAGEPFEVDAARAGALEATRAAGLDLEGLTRAQRLGGDVDGAVLTAGTSHLRPGAEVLRLTAALAILLD